VFKPYIIIIIIIMTVECSCIKYYERLVGITVSWQQTQTTAAVINTEHN